MADAWQPIETAPKDGTVVFVACREASHPVAAQYLDAAYWEREYDDPEYMETGWWPAYGGLIDPPEWTIEPTHWMPLPALPQPRDPS